MLMMFIISLVLNGPSGCTSSGRGTCCGQTLHPRKLNWNSCSQKAKISVSGLMGFNVNNDVVGKVNLTVAA